MPSRFKYVPRPDPRGHPKGGDLGLQEAVRIVKSGTLESGVDRAALKSARFIVIFDPDETLYDQYYGGGETVILTPTSVTMVR